MSKCGKILKRFTEYPAPSGTCAALNEGGVICLPPRFLTYARGRKLDWNPIAWTATLTII